MNRILLSWVAVGHDFLHPGKVNPRGPTVNFHEKYFLEREIDRHLILAVAPPAGEPGPGHYLYSYLKKAYPDRSLDLELLHLSNPSLLEEVMKKSEPFLLQQDSQVEILASNGTPAMFAAWCFLAAKYGERLTVLQLMAPNFSEDKTHGDLEVVKAEKQWASMGLTLRSELKEQSKEFASSFQSAALKRAEEVGLSGVRNVCVRGASGTGKSYVAQRVHSSSYRRKKPFLAINCAAFNDELLLSELFGHKEGAFTGAQSNKIGVFERADGGVLFLDEIGDISPFMQVSLLRVIEDQRFKPVGEAEGEGRAVDLCIVTATNQDLEELCKAGRFRWDLYYRICVAEVYTRSVAEMSLMQRREMIRYFIEVFNSKYSAFREEPLHFDKEVWNYLIEYEFPGNIREMRNLIENLFTYLGKTKIHFEDLPPRILSHQDSLPKSPEQWLKRFYQHWHKRLGKISEVAEVTGVSRQTVSKYLKT